MGSRRLWGWRPSFLLALKRLHPSLGLSPILGFGLTLLAITMETGDAMMSHGCRRAAPFSGLGVGQSRGREGQGLFW